MYPYDYYSTQDMDYYSDYDAYDSSAYDPASYDSSAHQFGPWWGGFRPWWGVRPWWGFRPWWGWGPWGWRRRWWF